MNTPLGKYTNIKGQRQGHYMNRHMDPLGDPLTTSLINPAFRNTIEQ
jgi:hypothetical protein